MKNRIIYLYTVVLLFMGSCNTEENDFDKITFPYTDKVGEYVVDIELTQPFAANDHVTIILSNTSANNDSLWLEDANFFESKVRVKVDGNTFSTVEGDDILLGEVVNVTGEFFPVNDSIHVEWIYLQGGDPADDYVVVADGVLYNGLTN